MSGATAIWLDGQRAQTLPLPDRGLDYGDGLFETLLLQQGQPLYLELHWQRLQNGLQVLGFPACLPLLQGQLQQVLQQQQPGHRWSALRITVTRGGGPRGYAQPDTVRPRSIMSLTPLERDCSRLAAPAVLGLAAIAWGSQPALAGIKHLNRLEQVLAASQARAQGWDEALMLDQSGLPVSVSAGNLFALFNDVLMTPPLQHCGVAGTRRQRLISEWAPAVGIGVSEAAFTLQQLAQASEVFYCNSLLGLRPVAELASRRWSEHPLCEALHRQYMTELPC